MKITITKDFGNFDVTAFAEVQIDSATPLVEELVGKGLLYVFERTPSTAVEQKVFAPMLGWEMGERGTSYKRPEGFKRNSVPYSKELGEDIAAAYNTSPGKIKVGGTDYSVKFTVTNITEHESGGDTSRKMATEMEGKLDAGMRLALGIKEDDSYDVRVEKCHKFLASLRKKK